MTYAERLEFLAESWNDEASGLIPPEFAVRFHPELLSLHRAIGIFETVSADDRQNESIALERKVRAFEDMVVRLGAFPRRSPN